MTAASTDAPADWMDAQAARRHRLLERLVFVVGFVVHLPALRARYLLDDYLHASMVRGAYPVPRAPYDLYDFVGDADREALFARGMLPWWSDPHLKVRFFRPLSSLLLWSERKVLGDQPLLLHALSFLWWVGAVLGARAIFRRVLGPRPALVATWVFALAPCHTLPLAWLANREALVSLTFGVLGLGAVLRVLDRGLARDALVALVAFALSALSGEYSLSLGAYVLAAALFVRGSPVQRRALALSLFAVPSAAYLVARSRLGYGTAGSGFYTDPLTEPLIFLEQAPRRLATLLANAWLSLDGETVSNRAAWWLLGGLFALAAILLVRSLLRAARELSVEGQGHARWLLVGSIFALSPVLAVVPSPRLLGASMIGIAALSGLILEEAWFRQRRAGEAYDQVGGLVALTVAFAHFVHAPVTAWLVGRHYKRSSAAFEAAAADLGHRLGDPTSADVLVMRGMGGSFFLPFALDPSFAPPARWRILAQTGHVLALRRAPNVLDLVGTREDGIYPTGPGNLFRNDRTHIAKGDVLELPGLRVTVLEMGKSNPRVVRFESDRDLDTYGWVAEQKSGFHDARPPAPGYGQPFDP